MSRHLIKVEVDTDRDQYGNEWGANFDGVEKHKDSEVRNFAETFGTADRGMIWDHPPYTRIVRIEKVSEGHRA